MVTKQNTPSPPDRNRGARAVCAVLPAMADISAPLEAHDADLVVNGQSIEVKWIGEGNLANIRRALEERRGRNVVLVGRQMSPGAREALSQAGVSWADETGAAEIAIGAILVSRSGVAQKRPSSMKRWTPAVLAVAEGLLYGVDGTQAAMQEATGLSAGSCANALRFLQDRALVTASARRGPTSARRVADRRGLLAAYAAAANAQPTRLRLQIGVTWQDTLAGLADLGHRLDDRGEVWVVTGGAGAAAIAPFMSSVSQATVYVDCHSVAELRALAESLKLRPVEGGRLTLQPFPTDSTRQLATVESDDLRVAPWPRLYADLQTEGVRGEEAAEHLYEVIHARRDT